MATTPAIAILEFWFDDPAGSASEYGQQRKLWFQKDPALDQQIRDRFLTVYEQARHGTYDHWLAAPKTALALTVLLDQFPRNMFRDTPRSFEADAQALSGAQAAIAQGHDQALLPVERMFFYLPFEHSEHLGHQHQAVAFFEALVQVDSTLQSTLEYAYRHRDVVAQFGRFPHRNAILGRPSTPAETRFLQTPGSRF
ncbi:MAG TPA: DUF924 family protein [Candidatus Obscuribacterales bacterium]